MKKILIVFLFAACNKPIHPTTHDLNFLNLNATGTDKIDTLFLKILLLNSAKYQRLYYLPPCDTLEKCEVLL